MKVGGIMPSGQSYPQIGQTVGPRLRAARLAKKYTQSQLASPDFSVSYISAIERGQIQPSLRALEIFALRLGTTSTDLLSTAPPGANGTAGIESVIQSEEEIELQLLQAQLFIQQGAEQRAITLLRNLRSPTLTTQQQIRLRYLLGWVYSNLAMFQEAESALAEAEKLARDPGDHLSLRILNLLGTVHTSMHNFAQGLEYQQLCLERLEREQQPRDTFFTVEVYTGIGLAYAQMDKFDEAIQAFGQAISLVEELTTTDQLASMYGDVALHFARAKDYYYALLFGYKLLQLRFQEYRNSLRSEIYHYLSRAMMRGDQQRALAYLQESLQEVAALQDQLSLASLTTHMAEWLLMNGRVDEAYENAQKASTLASSSGDTLIAAYALLVLGQVEYAQKAYEAGDEHFVAGLEMLERLGAREELTEQSARYAQLLEDRDMPEQALKYYKKAIESHQ
jgi:tetratricopeptide (TPR) repeat protein